MLVLKGSFQIFKLLRSSYDPYLIHNNTTTVKREANCTLYLSTLVRHYNICKSKKGLFYLSAVLRPYYDSKRMPLYRLLENLPFCYLGCI